MTDSEGVTRCPLMLAEPHSCSDKGCHDLAAIEHSTEDAGGGLEPDLPPGDEGPPIDPEKEVMRDALTVCVHLLHEAGVALRAANKHLAKKRVHVGKMEKSLPDHLALLAVMSGEIIGLQDGERIKAGPAAQRLNDTCLECFHPRDYHSHLGKAQHRCSACPDGAPHCTRGMRK